MMLPLDFLERVTRGAKKIFVGREYGPREVEFDHRLRAMKGSHETTEIGILYARNRVQNFHCLLGRLHCASAFRYRKNPLAAAFLRHKIRSSLSSNPKTDGRHPSLIDSAT